MSPLHIFVLIVLLGFFFLAPGAIYVFAKCFTGRKCTFLDYNRDAQP